MGEGEGGRRLRLRPRGASAPEGEPLARRGVAKEGDFVCPVLIRRSIETIDNMRLSHTL